MTITTLVPVIPVLYCDAAALVLPIAVDDDPEETDNKVNVHGVKGIPICPLILITSTVIVLFVVLTAVICPIMKLLLFIAEVT